MVSLMNEDDGADDRYWREKSMGFGIALAVEKAEEWISTEPQTYSLQEPILFCFSFAF